MFFVSKFKERSLNLSNESINAEEKQEPPSISSSAVPNASVKVISMAVVPLLEVDWLWKPYILFGKVTIIQGNPGEGKTTLALRLASACSRGKAFHEMEAHEPFNVIYQTAEDGLGDTIKPRLIEAEADLSRVFVIDEADKVLSLPDERIEKAIKEKHTRLIILDPLQGYLGTDTDMNRANEIRPIFRRLGEIAQETGCAVVLIEHLNKATGSGSAYRGLGSMDFRAAARSVLLVGRLRKEPNVRVIIRDKSSFAPNMGAVFIITKFKTESPAVRKTAKEKDPRRIGTDPKSKVRHLKRISALSPHRPELQRSCKRKFASSRLLRSACFRYVPTLA